MNEQIVIEANVAVMIAVLFIIIAVLSWMNGCAYGRIEKGDK